MLMFVSCFSWPCMPAGSGSYSASQRAHAILISRLNHGKKLTVRECSDMEACA